MNKNPNLNTNSNYFNNFRQTPSSQCSALSLTWSSRTTPKNWFFTSELELSAAAGVRFTSKHTECKTQMHGNLSIGILRKISTNCRYVLWMRGNKSLTKFLQRNRFIYPFLVALLISTLSFPPWLGQYQAGHMGTHDQIALLFSHHSWTDNSNSSEFPNTWVEPLPCPEFG